MISGIYDNVITIFKDNPKKKMPSLLSPYYEAECAKKQTSLLKLLSVSYFFLCVWEELSSSILITARLSIKAITNLDSVADAQEFSQVQSC